MRSIPGGQKGEPGPPGPRGLKGEPGRRGGDGQLCANIIQFCLSVCVPCIC